MPFADCSISSKYFVALGIIAMLAGIGAAGGLVNTIGYSSFALAGGGLVIGTALIAMSRCCKTAEIRPVMSRRLTGESLAAWRVRLCGTDTDTSMVHFSLIQTNPHYMKAQAEVAAFLRDPIVSSFTPREELAMGIMLGMACGDALGAPFEFLPYKKEGYTAEEKYNKFTLEEGQWTDDTAMGLCLADVLIENGSLDDIQLMWAFSDWWKHGYNNAFTVGDAAHSVGLGENVGQAFRKFQGYTRHDTGPYSTTAGDKFTSGNGSLMRLGPVAIFAGNYDEARKIAWQQSKVTHQGDEAAGCCQLMSHLLFVAINDAIAESDPLSRKEIIFESLKQFTCDVPSVCGLAQSQRGVLNPKSGKPENWDWQSEDFTYNAERLAAHTPGPGYIGSYAMDGLAMALHCVYSTSSFEEAVLKAATRGGDADTVAAITGQLAGAIYGVQAIPKKWVGAVQKWDRCGEIATRGFLLSRLSH
jgi:ADP-ribosylglycohydrolase